MTGIAIWTTKSILRTKQDYDNMFISKDKIDSYSNSKIIDTCVYNFIFYSPNIVLWPINIASDIYIECIRKYYVNKVKKND